MFRLKLFIISLFTASIGLAIVSGPVNVGVNMYIKTLLLFWFFSFLYSHLNITVKKGSVNMDYGISYGLAIALFAGPLGLLIFETIHRFTVYISRRRSKTADPDEFLHTFYNIGSFTINNSIAYLLFTQLMPVFQQVPFGFWLLIILLIITVSILSDLYLIIIFSLTGDITTRKGAIEFIKSRSVLDMGKVAISNGLLLIFLQEQQWEVLVGLFLLNYLVSRSFMIKSQSIQHKMERDKFEQMAYTDFLTEVYNRTYMDKIMNELNQSQEIIGIIVTDIDTFKQINDTYNHAVGDYVIQHFAASMQAYLGDKDYLFRSGGEEFTIFLRNRDFEQCSALTQKLQQGIEKSTVKAEYQSNEKVIAYTASFGLYYFKADIESDIKKAYTYADDQLIIAKNRGKNTVSIKNGLLEAPGHVQKKM